MWKAAKRPLLYRPQANPYSSMPAFPGSTTATQSRLVKIFMRRECNTEVSRRGALDSGCQVADWAQGEQGQGRAQRCSCLGGFSPGDNDQGKRSGCAAARLRRTRLVSISILPLLIA